jgi:hypothetical protein
VTSDGYGLLVLACSPRLDLDGSTLTATVPSRAGALAVTLVARDVRQVRARYTCGPDDARRGRVERAVTVRRVEITARSSTESDVEPEVGLLGLTGPIEVDVGVVDRVPVEVRGRVPKLGRVRVKLVELGW